MGAGGTEDRPKDYAFDRRPLGPNSLLGRYRLCHELASGGMGAVYLARVEGPGRFDKLLALKCIHPHLAEDSQFVEMFLDEARIAARITHPNVCSVFDFGMEDDTYFIAMEYLLGETAGRIARSARGGRTRLSPEMLAGYFCNIAAQAAEGLHAAHELPGDTGTSLNVIHRDVSPANLFVCYDGNVQVMDFGIARAAGRIHVTQTGAMKGKISYMAPEQLKRLELDRRVDVWSLGVVLWEMLTGKRLFRRASDIDSLAAVAADPIPRPSELVRGLPPRVDEIVMRALCRDRNARYQTAREMARELHRFVATLPEPIGVAEVGDWMQELFHDERRRQLELSERARRLGIEGVPSVSAGLLEEVSDVRLQQPALGPVPSGEPVEASDQHTQTSTDTSLEVDPADEMPSWADEDLHHETVIDPTPPVGEDGPHQAHQVHEMPTSAARRPRSAPWEGWLAFWNGTSLRVRSAVAGACVLAIVVGIWAATGGDPSDTEPEAEPIVPTTAPAAHPRPTVPSTPSDDPAVQEPETTLASQESSAPSSAQSAPADPAAPTDRPAGLDPDAPAPSAEEPDLGSPPEDEVASDEDPRATSETREPPARPIRRQAPAAPGVVVVIATGGWADVYENGRRLGRTPARLRLPAGRHVLELRPFGASPSLRRPVVIPAGGETRLSVPVSR